MELDITEFEIKYLTSRYFPTGHVVVDFEIDTMLSIFRVVYDLDWDCWHDFGCLRALKSYVSASTIFDTDGFCYYILTDGQSSLCYIVTTDSQYWISETIETGDHMTMVAKLVFGN